MYVLMNKKCNRVLLSANLCSVKYSGVNNFEHKPHLEFNSWIKAWVYKTFCYGDCIIPLEMYLNLKEQIACK